MLCAGSTTGGRGKLEVEEVPSSPAREPKFESRSALASLSYAYTLGLKSSSVVNELFAMLRAKYYNSTSPEQRRYGGRGEGLFQYVEQIDLENVPHYLCL